MSLNLKLTWMLAKEGASAVCSVFVFFSRREIMNEMHWRRNIAKLGSITQLFTEIVHPIVYNFCIMKIEKHSSYTMNSHLKMNRSITNTNSSFIFSMWLLLCWRIIKSYVGFSSIFSLSFSRSIVNTMAKMLENLQQTFTFYELHRINYLWRKSRCDPYIALIFFACFIHLPNKLFSAFTLFAHILIFREKTNMKSGT